MADHNLGLPFLYLQDKRNAEITFLDYPSKTCIKSGSSRLAKSEKAEFIGVNEHFEDKHNAEITFLDSF